MTSTAPDVVRRLRIDAPAETVWEFWTRPERLAEWWGRAQSVAEVGGAFVVTMESGGVMRGEYLTLEPPHRLEFTFGWDGGGPVGGVPPGSTRVEVTLVQDGESTDLTLRHFDLPVIATVTHGEGWDHFLPVLAASIRRLDA